MPYITKEMHEEYLNLHLALKTAAEDKEAARIAERAREVAAERKYKQDVLDYCEARRAAGDPVCLSGDRD
jgi:hypothetical protein